MSRGYIYTFEIRDPDDSKTVQLKVGRAVNVVKRLNEWGTQCGSKEQVLRGFYPGSVGGWRRRDFSDERTRYPSEGGTRTCGVTDWVS